MRPPLFGDVSQRMLVITDVLGQPISPILKGQATVHNAKGNLTLNDKTQYSEETISRRFYRL